MRQPAFRRGGDYVTGEVMTLSGTLSGALLFGAVASAAGGIRILQRFYDQPPVVDPVAGTETWTVEEIEALRQGSEEIGVRLRRQVGIVATVGPGPDGVLTTPEGGVECVWWRMERIRHYTELDDGKQYHRTERVGHNWSRSTFTLTDETGTLIVRPADADVIGAPEVYSHPEEFEPDGSALATLMGRGTTTTDLVYVEHALPVGSTIFVHGEAHSFDERFVTIVKPLDGGPLILSTQPEHLIRSEAKEKLMTAELTRWKGYGLFVLAALMFFLIFVI